VSRLIDITRMLGRDHLVYPGDDAFKLERIREAGVDKWEQAKITLSDHTGTHLDAPAHFFAGGKSIEGYALERFFVPARVVEIAAEADCIESEHVRDLPIRPGDAVLFKTRNSFLPRNEVAASHVYISSEAAELLVQRKAGLVGIDYLSVDAADVEGFPVHKLILANDILILNDVNLCNVAAGHYHLICFPLAICNVSGAPCRAVLMKQY